ncbi:response regulator [Roseateles sp. NT4]|uniref:response regulator n=1 Tax=Roseateles sp. NT4 TaxID=3453715 RepID=UPI003EEB3F6E
MERGLPYTGIAEEEEAEVHFGAVARGMRSGVASGIFAVPLFIAGLNLRGPLDWSLVLSWVGVMVGVLLAYYPIAPLRLRWQAAGRMDLWWRLLLSYNFVVGLAWGSCGLLFFDADPVRLLVLLVLQMGMMLSVAPSMAPLTLATYANLLPCALPLVVRGLLDPAPIGKVMGLAVLLMLAFMMAYAHVFARTQLESVRMRFENRRLNEALTEQRVRERTAVLEAASAHKSAFLATVSHEIRTPMNAIIGMTHLALNTAREGHRLDYLRKIKQSSQHLLRIINDILDFSKIEADKLELENIDFDLASVLDDFATVVSEKATTKGLELIFDVARGVPNHLVGDPVRLGQILINYGSNAVKFTAQGEVVVRVRKIDSADDGVKLRFEVSDTGIGLNESQIALLFQSFQQADSSTSRQFGGTGLGLAIAKRLAGLMDGEVGVHSAVGVGSTFWFTARLGLGREVAPTTHPRDLRGRRVLVVDDNESARTVLVGALEGFSIRAESRGDGAGAVEAVALADAAGDPFDALLIDWHMPGMDGIETSRRLHGLPLLSSPRQLLITAFDRDEALRLAAPGQFDDVLVKPINPSTLLDRLMHVLVDGLPAAEPDDASDSPSAALLALRKLRGTRVLVVDDNAINRQIVGELLRDAGLIVDESVDGEQALQALRDQPYDVVLMDMHMPVMDGPAAARAIRARPELAELPVIAMTANVMQADRKLCLDAGMNAFLNKPIEPDRLYELVTTWVRPAHVVAPRLQAAAAGTEDAAALQAALEALRQAPGLDVATGLRRSGYKPALYVSVLQQFLASQGSFAEQLEASLKEGRATDALRLAHTLKGTAGNLGAVALQAAAERLEQGLQQGSAEQTPALVLETTACLDALLANLRRSLPTAAAGPAAACDVAEWREVGLALRQQLSEGFPEVRGATARHAALLQAAMGADYKPFTEAVRVFDYDGALEVLERCLQQHDIQA